MPLAQDQEPKTGIRGSSSVVRTKEGKVGVVGSLAPGSSSPPKQV